MIGWALEPWLTDAADLLAEPDPGPTPWLVENLIVDGALVACVGRWKTTKSYALLDLCIAIATGRPAFGTLTVATPGPVIFCNEESGRTALWRRLDALARGRAINPEEFRGRLMVAANAWIKLDDPAWQEELVAMGRELRPRLFALDPLARMKAAGRKENAQDEMAELIDFIRRLRDETGAAVAFVHHTGHAGSNMRGSSDLESFWESRLTWTREQQSPLVTLESEHREAEPGAPLTYRIGWDGVTRSMRFDLEVDPLEVAVRAHLQEHPDDSANDVDKAIDGTRQTILALVKSIREQGGSTTPEPPPNHPPLGTLGGGSSRHPSLEGSGTTTPEPGSNGTEPPLLGDPGYPMLLDLAYTAGHVTAAELTETLTLHALVARSRQATA